jgi:hypothetical protein
MKETAQQQVGVACMDAQHSAATDNARPTLFKLEKGEG